MNEPETESVPNAAAAPRPVLSRGRHRGFLFVTLVVVAVIQEIAFRWMFPLPEVRNFNRLDYTPLAGSEAEQRKERTKGIRNVVGIWKGKQDDFVFYHTLNLYGFRGPNFAVEPPPGRTRVVFIGDSFVESCGAADADTLTVQFARQLPDRPPVEAINLGVLGVGFPEYLKLAMDSLPLLRPNTVFLVVCWNDLPAPPLPDFLPASRAFPRYNPFMPRAYQLIDILREGGRLAFRFPRGPFPINGEKRTAPDADDPRTREMPTAVPGVEPADLLNIQRAAAVGDSWIKYVANSGFPENGGVAKPLRRLAAFCNSLGTRLVLVYVPYNVAIDLPAAEFQSKLTGIPADMLIASARKACRLQRKHLADAANSVKIPFLDSTEELIHAEKTRGPMYWRVDGHCTAAGYHVLAEVCARYWTENRGVDTPRSP